MKRKQNERLCLTDRDKRIFHYLFVNKVATIDQIRRDNYGDIALQSIYVRLRKLKDKGFLHTSAIPGQKGFKTVYSITKLSFSRFVKERYDNIKGLCLKSDAIEHDLALVDIRSVMQTRNLVDSYFTENQSIAIGSANSTSTWGSLISCRVDGVVKLNVGNGQHTYVGLEYEGSLKNKERCHKKVNNYYLRPDIEAILFVCKDTSISKRFIDIEKEMRPEGRHKLFLANLEDVKRNNLEIVFENIKGTKIIFK